MIIWARYSKRKMSYADLNIAGDTSTEIRGPPVDSADSLTVSYPIAYATSDESAGCRSSAKITQRSL